MALLLSALAACGGSGDEERFDPFTAVRDRTSQRPEQASPRWETVTTLSGSGPRTQRVEIAREAIQWRARWRCESGRLRITAGARTLGDSRCPAHGERVDIGTGEREVRVHAPGRWQLVVEQQVDTPLHEPPLRLMNAPDSRVIATGRFYGIERRGRGRAALHRLPTGRLALRLENFATSPNTDLFVWLSTAARPRTTVEAARSRHRVVHELKSTIGDQNYLVPARVEPRDIRSIVIWCVPVRIAYAAAPLRPR